MNALISRTTMKPCYPHESPNSSASVLLLLEIGSGDGVVLAFPVGFKNSPWKKKQKKVIFLQELQT